MKMLSFDPGTRAMGFCLWGNLIVGDSTRGKYRPLLEAFVLTPRDKATWQQSVVDIVAQLEDRFALETIKLCVSEWPEVMGGEKAFAANQSGDILKLAYAVGAVMQWAISCKAASYQIVPVTTWKGQLPKAVVADRVKVRVGNSYTLLSRNMSHDWDAAGIGLWAQGRF